MCPVWTVGSLICAQYPQSKFLLSVFLILVFVLVLVLIIILVLINILVLIIIEGVGPLSILGALYGLARHDGHGNRSGFIISGIVNRILQDTLYILDKLVLNASEHF